MQICATFPCSTNTVSSVTGSVHCGSHCCTWVHYRSVTSQVRRVNMNSKQVAVTRYFSKQGSNYKLLSLCVINGEGCTCRWWTQHLLSWYNMEQCDEFHDDCAHVLIIVSLVHFQIGMTSNRRYLWFESTLTTLTVFHVSLLYFSQGTAHRTPRPLCLTHSWVTFKKIFLLLLIILLRPPSVNSEYGRGFSRHKY